MTFSLSLTHTYTHSSPNTFCLYLWLWKEWNLWLNLEMIFLRFYFNDDDDVDVAKCYAKPFMTDGWERKRGEREKRERRGGGHQRRNTTKCSHNGRNTQSEEKPSPPWLEWKLKRSKNVCFCCLLYFYCFPPCPQTCVNLKWLSILISPSLSRCLVKCVDECVRVWVCACVCLTSFSILTKILNGWLINEKRLNRCVQKNDECGRKSESSDARNNSLERKRKDSISVTSDGERKKKLNVKLRLMNLGFSCRRRQRRHRRHRRQQRRTRNKTKWWIDKLSIWEVVKIRGLILMTAASLIDFFKHFVIIAAAAAVVKCNKTREERERARARERDVCQPEKVREREFFTHWAGALTKSEQICFSIGDFFLFKKTFSFCFHSSFRSWQKKLEETILKMVGFGANRRKLIFGSILFVPVKRY